MDSSLNSDPALLRLFDLGLMLSQEVLESRLVEHWFISYAHSISKPSAASADLFPRSEMISLM